MISREKEEFARTIDCRTQERSIRAGKLSTAKLEAHLNELPDVSSLAVVCEMPQPALGSFDQETLQNIQRNFKRYTYNSHR